MHLLIKPASGSCNMRCRYCFYADETKNRQHSSYGFMDIAVLEQCVSKALESGDGECTFAFQGGEPTLVGLDFYKKLIEFENKYNDRGVLIHNALQTNGYLIDDDWAQFFAENNFLIGISVDGTKHVHDLYRRGADGKGTHDRIMRAVETLKRHQVDFNVLTVVTAQCAERAREVYSYFRNNDLLYQQYIPCLDPLAEARGIRKYSLTPKRYGKFLMDLFDCWYEDLAKGTYVSIRYFENLVGMLRGYPPESCGMIGHCAVQNVVEADGGVYPCDYYVLDEYLLGNLQSDSFAEINERRRKSGFIEQSLKPHQDCLACQWARICRGGCRRDRTAEKDGSLGVNYYCAAYKMFFEYAMPRLVRLARHFAQSQVSQT